MFFFFFKISELVQATSFPGSPLGCGEGRPGNEVVVQER